jgi:hypothetical protein
MYALQDDKTPGDPQNASAAQEVLGRDIKGRCHPVQQNGQWHGGRILGFRVHPLPKGFPVENPVVCRQIVPFANLSSQPAAKTFCPLRFRRLRGDPFTDNWAEFNTANDDVIEQTVDVETSGTRHERKITEDGRLVN